MYYRHDIYKNETRSIALVPVSALDVTNELALRVNYNTFT